MTVKDGFKMGIGFFLAGVLLTAGLYVAKELLSEVGSSKVTYVPNGGKNDATIRAENEILRQEMIKKGLLKQ